MRAEKEKKKHIMLYRGRWAVIRLQGLAEEWDTQFP